MEHLSCQPGICTGAHTYHSVGHAAGDEWPISFGSQRSCKLGIVYIIEFYCAEGGDGLRLVKAHTMKHLIVLRQHATVNMEIQLRVPKSIPYQQLQEFVYGVLQLESPSSRSPPLHLEVVIVRAQM